MRPEHRALLLAARPTPDIATLAHALVADMDWEYLIDTAAAHGVLPLLYRATERSGAHPVLGAAPLDEAFRSSTHRSLGLTAELVRVLGSLEEAGLQALPYKGPTLAVLAYGDLSDRYFLDLDILIDRRGLEGATGALRTLGYAPQFELTRRELTLYLRTQSDLTFVSNDHDTVVELQWAIAPPYFSFPMSFDALWSRRQEVELAGRSIPTVGPEDLLLMLCVHASKHLWERLAWVSDVAHVLARLPIDWDSVLLEARRRGALRMLLLGLDLSRGLLGSNVPAQVRDLIRRDPSARRIARRIASSMFDPLREEPRMVARSLAQVRMWERASDRIRYLVRVGFRPNEADWHLVQLPARLYPAYYVVRPARIAWESARSLPGRISRR
jgi:hypothetical protein